MALGMTRDSMQDLQGLLQKESSTEGVDTVSLLTTGQSNECKAEYNKLVAAPDDDHEEEDDEISNQVREVASMRDPARGSSSSETNDETQPNPQESQDSSIASMIEGEERQQEAVPATGQYSGFAAGYEAYDYDPYQIHYSHTPPTILGANNKSSSGGWLCCLFPWLAQNNPNARVEDAIRKEAPSYDAVDDGGRTVQSNLTTASSTPLRKSNSVSEEDEVSSAGDVSVGSEKLGEKLSDKDRQAVLARLRLVQPDRPSENSGDAPEPGSLSNRTAATSGKENGLLNELPQVPASEDDDAKSETSVATNNSKKGILKRTSTAKKVSPPQKDGKDGRRRSLFPVYETNQPKKKSEHNVKFAPMARVVTVKSQKDMSPEEKSHIWWQKWDYEDFRKTGRIITRAMLEGGSEIWLASNQSWQHLGASKSATLKNAMSLSERNKQKGEQATDLIRNTGDKWWHKFGHSRRGLEHIASIKEGSERQANVRHAIRAVLDEQRRQKTYMREDLEKLRMISIHNTSWARDLALAAGQSDADAVKSEFDEERKSREFYLLKMARSNAGTSQGKHVPAFMKPSMASFSPKLDAHTSAQIMDRRKQHRHRLSLTSDVTSSVAPPDKRTSSETGKKSLEAIHDKLESGESDLAKRAAGFSHDGEQVNMAAVLSGMGAVPKIAQPV